MIVVKTGTTSYRRIANISEKEADEVVFDGTIAFNSDNELDMIWDGLITNIRQVNPSEKTINKRAKLETDIDNLAAEKIAALFGKPVYSTELIVKQQNYQARVTEIIEKESVGLKRLSVLQEIVINGGTLTSEEVVEKAILFTSAITEQEQSEKSAIQDAFTLIKAIRMYGKTLKTDLATSAPETFDIDIGWPV